MNDFQRLVLAYIIFIVVDLPWLLFSKKYWLKVAGTESFNPFPAALLAYVALAVAVIYIGIPLAKHYTNHPILIPGILLGFTIYFCFDMTNRVIFGKRYPWWLAFADTVWGMIASTVTLWLVTKVTKLQ